MPVTFRFTIADMDCSEEVRALQRELVPLAGEAALRFDTLGRLLTVTLPPGSGVTEDSIIRAVARTGMRAEPAGSSHRATPPAAAPAGQGPTACRTHGGCAGQGEHTHAAPDLLGDVGCPCCGHDAPTRGVSRFRASRTLLCVLSGALIAAGLGLKGGGLTAPGNAALLGAALLGLYAVLPKAWYALRKLRPDMNLLMVVAVVGAVFIGDLLEAATVSFLFALSNLLESWSTGKARRAIQSLLDITPHTALMFEDGPDGAEASGVTERPVEEVPVGARLLVRPGDRVPLDGEVVSGRSFVNQAPITGESVPVGKEPGATLFAGSVNGDGALIMRAARPAEDSTLARILHMVEEAQGNKARVLQWVEKFAAVYTPVMMAAALALAVLPPLLFDGAWSRWGYEALVLLVIACPCALVISTPVCITASLATAARNGVLIKGGVYLELPARLDALALDKTGTLTTGAFAVRRVVPLGGRGEDEVLALAAALEGFSSHPIARAVRDEARRRSLVLPPVADAAAVPGLGARGTLTPAGEASVPAVHHIGSRRYLEDSLSGEAAAQAALALARDAGLEENSGEDAPGNAVFLWNDEEVLGAIVAEDTLRPEAVRAVADLKELGVRDIIMLTGDNPVSAKAVAWQAGVTEVHAGLMPEDKARLVAAMTQTGKVVAMTGDGINDAPALASASIGIAMGAAGTDVAIETADIALMADDLGKIPWLVRLARRNLRAIRQNIAFALGLKALFAILAVFGVASLWMAILADVGASLLVIANGMRLLRAPASALPPVGAVMEPERV